MNDFAASKRALAGSNDEITANAGTSGSIERMRPLHSPTKPPEAISGFAQVKRVTNGFATTGTNEVSGLAPPEPEHKAPGGRQMRCPRAHNHPSARLNQQLPVCSADISSP